MIRPPRPCTSPGCSALTATGGRCEQHPHRRNRRAEPYEQQRPESDRWYGTQRWRKLRNFILSQSPLCVECERLGKVKLATVVDHIIPLREQPDLAMDLENLRTLCHACHNRIGKKVSN